MLARLRAAAEVANRDPATAAKLYDDIAADRSVGVLEQDLAKIRAAGLLLDTTSYPNMLQRLEPATAAGAPLRHTAPELLALSARRAGGKAAGPARAGPRLHDTGKPPPPRRAPPA